MSDSFDGCDETWTIALLALFLDVKQSSREKAYSEGFRKRIVKFNKTAEELENIHVYAKSSWMLCDELCDVVLSWMLHGSMSAVYSETNCELYEGEIVRQMLKLNNICRETRAAAQIAHNDKLTKMLENHQSLLIHGIVTPQSLYVN